MSLPLDLIASPLQHRLAVIETGVSVLLESVTAREELVRAEMHDAVEQQRIGRAEEALKRKEIEQELKAEREKATQVAKLIEEFADGGFGKGAVV